MAHVAKYTKAQVGGMTRHYERAKKDNGEYQLFANQEIDTSKSHLNYNLAPERDGGQLGFIRERCSAVKCHKRDDVKVMCSWVVTAPKGLEEYEYDRFFRLVYDFLNDRYGEDRHNKGVSEANGNSSEHSQVKDKNVISAYVHMDETTPHMHYAFVPVTVDKKKGHEKVSAKEVLTRQDLQTFHQDLENYLVPYFGREVGILNGATAGGNKTVDELKKAAAVQEYNELLEKTSDLQSEVSDLQSEIFGLQSEVSSLQSKSSKLQDEILNLEEKEALLDVQIMGLEHNMAVERLNEQNLASKLQDEVNDLEGKRGALEGLILDLNAQINPLQQNLVHLTAVDAEYQAKKKYIAEAKKSSDISMMYPSYAEISTRGFGRNKAEYVTVPREEWEDRHVSANEIDNLKKMQASLEKSISDFRKSQSGKNYHAMTSRIGNLESKVDSLRDENARLQGRVKEYERQLDAKVKESEALWGKVNRVLDKDR